MLLAFTELYLTVLFCFTELSFYSAFVLHLTIFIVLELVSSYLQSQSTASEVEKANWLMNKKKNKLLQVYLVNCLFLRKAVKNVDRVFCTPWLSKKVFVAGAVSRWPQPQQLRLHNWIG